jgi:hypothetical protein
VSESIFYSPGWSLSFDLQDPPPSPHTAVVGPSQIFEKNPLNILKVIDHLGYGEGGTKMKKKKKLCCIHAGNF